MSRTTQIRSYVVLLELAAARAVRIFAAFVFRLAWSLSSSIIRTGTPSRGSFLSVAARFSRWSTCFKTVTNTALFCVGRFRQAASLSSIWLVTPFAGFEKWHQLSPASMPRSFFNRSSDCSRRFFLVPANTITNPYPLSRASEMTVSKDIVLPL